MVSEQTEYIDWTQPKVAAEHDNMNRKYFEDGIVGTLPYFANLEKAVRLAIGGNERLSCLDIGCGAGWQAKHLFSAGIMSSLKYEGLDISENMCERAKVNCPEGTYHVGDIMLFTPNRTWDLVMTCGVMELFADWRPFLHKLASLSSSKLIVHKLFFTEENASTKVTEEPAYAGFRECRLFLNLVEFTEELALCGFKIVDHYQWDVGNTHGIVAKRSSKE